jgi:flagellar motility protein MotE (MotC chaperone)
MVAKEENTETTAVAAEATPAAKSGMLKYIIIGGGAFVAVIVIAIAAMMFLGGDAPETTEAIPHDANVGAGDKAEETAHEEAADGAEPSFSFEEEGFADTLDPSVLDNIMDNLAFLDYQPEEDAATGAEDAVLPTQGSTETVAWLEAEKAALAEKAAELAARERELALLDKSVSKKLLTLEQAETSRTNDLAKLYDGMDARSVAQLMANLDDKTVVSLLPRMKTKNASAVMALMSPKRAANLSKQMITIAEN